MDSDRCIHNKSSNLILRHNFASLRLGEKTIFSAAGSMSRQAAKALRLRNTLT
jgi:hypothetical protein